MKKIFILLFACLCSLANASDASSKCNQLLSTNMSFFEEQLQEKISEAEAKLQKYKEDIKNEIDNDEQVQKLLKKIDRLEKKIKKLKEAFLDIDTAKAKLN